jgi:hypothetical protein
MDLELDDKNTKLYGQETIIYTNNAKEALDYLWVQLDQNQQSRKSLSPLVESNKTDPAISAQGFSRRYLEADFDGGFNIEFVKDALGKPMQYTINQTMMRIELPKVLKHGEKISFSIKWWYNINNYTLDGGRSGYEHFDTDGNNLYVIAQFYPRMAVYNDVEGWQNMQFWGSGEFALPFGNFEVNITVPADHILEATGNLLNRAEVFTPAQLARYAQAEKSFDNTVIVVTQAEAEAAEKGFSDKKKTWKFKADNVRDFGISTSRKFIYDAMAVKTGSTTAMAISLYPKEGNPLWEQYSTRIIAHTLKSYSSYTFDYPYPKAISINARDQGMEYPMICFNYGRTEKDGTYSEATKNGMLGVIIHEVGHNFFPMIINSDEREWTWMDEGLNTFVEYLTEELWDNKFPSRRGPAFSIVDYMKLPKEQLEPIMVNSENIIQLGANDYSKPSTGLNILRETIVGRKLFDFGFKEYARRWAFKHPSPADLFRTMNDATGENLDWFWRGWFYGIEPCDIAIDTVKHAVFADVEGLQPQSIPSSETRKVGITKPSVNAFEDISKIRNREDNSIVFQTDIDTSLRDFYWRYDRGIIAYDSSLKIPVTSIGGNRDNLTEAEKTKYANTHLYEITFSNKGGLVMPIIVEFTFEDGTKQLEKIPAQIWRKNENKVSKVFMTNKKATAIKLDPMRETADINESNNVWGNVDAEPSKFSIFKAKAAVRGQSSGLNPMQALK